MTTCERSVRRGGEILRLSPGGAGSHGEPFPGAEVQVPTATYRSGAPVTAGVDLLHHPGRAHGRPTPRYGSPRRPGTILRERRAVWCGPFTLDAHHRSSTPE